MRHQGTKHIFAYWQRLKGRRIAAERADFNPGDVGRFLADVILLEQSGAGRWTFRIAGSRLCALFGGEMRGQDFTAILLPQADADAAEMLGVVSEEALPVVAGLTMLFANGAAAAGELLLLPMLHEGRTDHRILGVLTFNPRERLVPGISAGIDILSFRVVRESDDCQALLPVEPELPFGAVVMEKRGHLTVLKGGLHQA